MAGDMFLKIEGIDGESSDEAHPNWIEIESWNINFNQTVAQSGKSTGGARTAERVNITDLNVTKVMDKSTPEIMFACATGKHIPTVLIEVCRASEKKEKYWEIKMTDVLISSVSPGQGTGTIPMDSISFNPGSIEWTYTEMSHGPGKPGGPIKHNWDMLKNKGG
jgi:type VI secretion system secreted protein Hcp